MGDTGLGRHRRSSGSQASVVIRITEACFSGVGRRRPTCVSIPPNTSNLPAWRLFSGSRRHGIQRKGLGNGFRYTRTEKIGAPFPSAHGMQTKSHTHRENIGSGGGSIQVSFANTHKTGTHHWAIYTGLHLLDIFFRHWEGVTPFYFRRVPVTFFVLFLHGPSLFPPKALGGLTGGHHWAGRMDLGGFRMAWKPGKGGKGRGVCFSPWVIPREPS